MSLNFAGHYQCHLKVKKLNENVHLSAPTVLLDQINFLCPWRNSLEEADGLPQRLLPVKSVVLLGEAEQVLMQLRHIIRIKKYLRGRSNNKSS